MGSSSSREYAYEDLIEVELYEDNDEDFFKKKLQECQTKGTKALMLNGEGKDQILCRRIVEAALLKYMERLNLNNIKLEITASKLDPMPDLVSLSLHKIETSDMPKFLEQILSLCPNVEQLNLTIDGKYSSECEITSEEKHDYFKSVAPLEKVKYFNI